jgi:hypothetical protein
MNKSALMITAVVLAAVLGGCSAAEPVEEAPPPATEVETEPVAPVDDEPAEASACALLDGIDIATLLGEAPGETTDSGGVCKIKAADAASAGAIIVQAVNAPQGAEYYERDKELLGSDGEIAGLGDAAHYAGPYRVNVLAGDNYLIVQVLRDLFGDIERLDDALLMEATRTALANTGW